jgi:hypothetical protein
MVNSAVIEAFSAERLRADLTHKVAARLVLSKRQAGPKRQMADSVASSMPASAEAGVVIDGERYALEPKRTQLTGRELLEAVHAAAGELVGSARVFLVHDGDPSLDKVLASLMEHLPQIVVNRRQALSERNIEALVDVFLGADPLAAAMPAIESDNAAAQAAFLTRWPVLTAEAVAEQAKHASRNRSATASRWKTARRIFGMKVSGREAYPAFQFQEGRPRKVIGKILAALPDEMTGWQTALWFTGPNGWMDGKTPLEMLADELAVVAAAAHERDAWMG